MALLLTNRTFWHAEVMRVREECQAAEFLARLADNLQSIPLTRSGALVTNIVTGGRQHMTGSTQAQSSRPNVLAGLSTQVGSLSLSLPLSIARP